MAEIVGKSKFEIMVTLMKALNVSSFDLKEIEKYLKKIKAVPDDNGGYSDTVCKAVVDHFRLIRDLEKGDKSMISLLKGQVKDLRKENQQLRDQVTALTADKTMLKGINDNLKTGFTKLSEQIDDAMSYDDVTTTDSSNTDDQQGNYQYNDYNNGVGLRSQQ